MINKGSNKDKLNEKCTVPRHFAASLLNVMCVIC